MNNLNVNTRKISLESKLFVIAFSGTNCAILCPKNNPSIFSGRFQIKTKLELSYQPCEL